MELREALTQIAEIRQQMARTQIFRGYRSATTAFSGLLALLAAAIQAAWIADPRGHVVAYLALWISAAVLSMFVIGGEIILRHRRSDSAIQRQITVVAIEQFVPALVAGGLITFVLVRFAPESLWMFPGLWAVVCSLGIFASRPMLPRGTALVAGFYLLAGLLCLALARGPYELWPWAMGLTFGIGQFLAAAVLYWNLERTHGQP